MIEDTLSPRTISNVEEVLLKADEQKHELAADVFVSRAGNNLRYRRLGQLVSITTPCLQIGIVQDDEDQRGRQTSADSSFLSLEVDAAIARIDVLVRERARSGTNAVSLVVDVSCLSRTVQGKIFAALSTWAGVVDVKLHIGYSLSRYLTPPRTWARSITPAESVDPFFAGWGAPDLPIHVVTGLGYESGKAIGIVQLIEPSKCTSLIPTSPEGSFLIAVENQNRDFLKLFPSAIMYEVLQPARTYLSLVSMISGILRDHRAILLPFGPKILFSLSLLISLMFREISVWHTKGEDNRQGDLSAPSDYGCLFSCLVSSPRTSDVRPDEAKA